MAILPLSIMNLFVLKQYPNRKIGFIWDACQAYKTNQVDKFIEEHKEELAKVGIDGRLTSVLHIVDLVSNKDLKHFIKDRYYMWRIKYICKKKLELIANEQLPNNAQINIKVPLPNMIKIVEDAMKDFNMKQRANEIIRKTFQKVYQDP